MPSTVLSTEDPDEPNWLFPIKLRLVGETGTCDKGGREYSVTGKEPMKCSWNLGMGEER